MADITNHLNTIINAIHGEDVRQAIHDAIEACYTDDRPGGADLKARQQINQILANMIGSTTYEDELWSGEMFVGGETTDNDIDLNTGKNPGKYPYVLVYFKTVKTAVPEIRMFRGSDFETGPIVITSPFLESDGSRATIREMHIKRRDNGTNLQYRLYYTYSWILGSVDSGTDKSAEVVNNHDVGYRRVVSGTDDSKGLILCKITGFNPIDDVAEEVQKQLEILMDFRDDIAVKTRTTVVDVTPSDPVGSSPYIIDLGTTLPANEEIEMTIYSTLSHNSSSYVYLRSYSMRMERLGKIGGNGTEFLFPLKLRASSINKIEIVNPEPGTTYRVLVQTVTETYNDKLATQEYLTENYHTKTQVNTIVAATEDRINTKLNTLQGTVNSKVSAETRGDVVMLTTSGDGVTMIPVASAGSVGQLSNLTTTNKSSVVEAINEVKESAGMNAQAAQALLDLFEHVRFSDDQALVYFNRLKSALGL